MQQKEKGNHPREDSVIEHGAFYVSQRNDPRHRTFFRVATLATLVLVIYTAFNLITGGYRLAAVEAPLAIFAAAVTAWGMAGRLTIKTMALLLSLIPYAFFTYLIVTGEAYGTGIYWGLIFPFIVFFLNGLHLGLIWIAAFFLLNALIFALFILNGTPLPFDPEILIRGAVAYCAVSAFAYFYEKQHFKYRFHVEQGKKKFEHLIEHTSDLITVIDPAGEFLFLSPSSERMIGFRPDELLGTSAFDLVHPEDRSRIKKRVTHLFLHPGERIRDQFRCRKKEGGWCILDSIAKASLDEQLVMTAVVNCRDITTQKNMETQLLQSQKMEAIGTLVGGIAHDFNNTLGAMKAALYLARQHAGEREFTEKRLNTIDELATHAAVVVQQLLAFARKDMIVIQSYNLNDFMAECFNLIENVIPENIKYDINLCGEDMIIKGDKTQCQQVLINLLNNACDAVVGRPNPEISVTLEHFTGDESFVQKHPGTLGREFAHVIVRDNGEGIPEELIEHIFEPFFTTRPVGEGTGLGLSMVYGTIKRHNGEIEIESRVGKGTAVHIYLPIEAAASETSLQQQSETELSPPHDHTLLLVDDDDIFREIISEALASSGYKVLTAASGKDALETFRQHRHEIAVIVTDVIMPGLGGVDLIRQVREINARMPAIFITGYDREETADFEDKSGRSTILNKPFPLEELTGAIGKLLEESRPAD